MWRVTLAELAIIKRNICLDKTRGSEWWKANRDEVMAELKKIEKETK